MFKKADAEKLKPQPLLALWPHLQPFLAAHFLETRFCLQTIVIILSFVAYSPFIGLVTNPKMEIPLSASTNSNSAPWVPAYLPIVDI